MTTWSRQSRRIDPISLSAYPFCHGDRGVIGRSRMPMAPTRRMKATVGAISIADKIPRRSFQPQASVNCCAIQSAVGCYVTPNHRKSVAGHAPRSTAHTIAGMTHSVPRTGPWRRCHRHDCEERSSSPAMGACLVPDHVLCHGGLADIDAELEQFAMDPRRSPQRIGNAHLADQFPDFCW